MLLESIVLLVLLHTALASSPPESTAPTAPTPPAPPVEPTALVFPKSVVMGPPLSRDEIADAMARHSRAFQRCYETALAKNAGLTGRVVLAFTIQADGTVHEARPSENTLTRPEVGDCLAKRVSELTFPQPRGGGIVEVTFPFEFTPPTDAKAETK